MTMTEREVGRLAQDGIRIALVIAGYNQAEVHAMTQFERASALLDMATEYASILPLNVEEPWQYDNRSDAERIEVLWSNAVAQGEEL